MMSKNYQLRVRGQEIQLEGQSSVSTLLGRQVSGKISGGLQLERTSWRFLSMLAAAENSSLKRVAVPIDSVYLRNKKPWRGLEVFATIALSGGESGDYRVRV